MTSAISLFVADDHSLVREMLAGQLGRERDIEVVGSAASAEEALERAVALEPDVVLLDIDMPGMVSFDAAREIRRRCGRTHIIFLSAFFHDRYIEEALRTGASGYLTKNEPPESLIDAIRKVSQGVSCFSPEVQTRLVVDVTGLRLRSSQRTRASMLTDRELETLRYIARGMAKKEIAELMHLSVRTVDSHVRHIMNKLSIHDRVELARFAIREGLAEP